VYKISDFSKITVLSVKALRYYDEEGILVPSFRDDNGYRFYSEADFKKAQLVALLRVLDFSIAELKDVLENYSGEEDLSYFLSEKKLMIEEKIKNDRLLIKKLESFLKPKKEECFMDYKVEIKNYDEMTVASMRFKGAYSEVGKYFGPIFKEVQGKADGAPFSIYYDDCYAEMADIEVCVPTKGLIKSTAVTAEKLPAVRAICTTHIGSYETINLAYKALTDYAAANSLETVLPSREIYIKGPGMIFAGNPNKFVTEVMIPLK